MTDSAEIRLDRRQWRSVVDGYAEAVLEFVGERFATVMKENIGIQGPPRSKPGEYPRMDTRELHDGVYWEVDPEMKRVIISSTADHTPHVEAIRPFMSRTLDEEYSSFSGWIAEAEAVIKQRGV